MMMAGWILLYILVSLYGIIYLGYLRMMTGWILLYVLVSLYGIIYLGCCLCVELLLVVSWYGGGVAA